MGLGVIIRFGEFELDPRRRELRRNGEPLRVAGKVLTALIVLVQNRDRVVSKEELVQRLWPQEFVTDSSLTYCVSMVRRLLGRNGPHRIENCYGTGYRFQSPRVEELPGAALEGPPAAGDDAPEAAERSERFRAPARAALRNPAQIFRASMHAEPPFVGRDGEMRRLRELAEAVYAGGGAVALLAGEAGIGKTRLCAELAGWAARRRFRVLSGACAETGGRPAYGPFAEALLQLLRDLPPEELAALCGEHGAWLLRVLPELQGVVDVAPARATLPPEREREQILESAVAVLLAAAARQPVLLVLEDFHWADPSTLLLCRVLARRIAAAPVLALITYRHVEVGPEHGLTDVIAELGRLRCLSSLRVGGLDLAAVQSMLTGQAWSAPPEAVGRELHRETEGNPLFVQECARLLFEEGRLFDAAGNWAVRLESHGLDLPAGVRTVIQRRLKHLSATTRKLLGAAAAIGRSFAFDVLEDVIELDSEALIDALEEAEAAHLVACREERPRIVYGFTHELIWQGLYRDMSPPRRQRLHRRIGEVMEVVFHAEVEARADQLAYHFLAAGAGATAERARYYSLLAGDRARTAGAYDEAIRHYRAAAEITEPRQRPYLDVLFRLAGALQSAGRWSEAEQAWSAAIELAEVLGDHAAVELGCQGLSWLHSWRGEFAPAFLAAQRGLTAAPDSRSRARAQLLCTVGTVAGLSGEAVVAEQMITEALRIAEEHREPELLGNALATLGVHQRVYLQCAEALRSLDGAERCFRQCGDPLGLARCQNYLLPTLGYLGRLEQAEAVNAALKEHADRCGDAVGLAMHALMKAVLALARGELAQARQWTETATDLSRRGAMLVLPAALQLRGEVLALGAELADAECALEEASQLHEAMSSPVHLYVGPLQRVIWRAAVGDRERARAVFDLATRTTAYVQPLHCAAFDELVMAAHAAALLGLEAVAARCYPLLAAAGGELVFSSGTHGLVQRVLGMAAAAMENGDRAAEHFEVALSQAQQLGARKELAETCHRFADLLLARGGNGGRKRARTLLEQAVELYGGMGLERRLHAARESLERLRAPAPPSTRPAAHERDSRDRPPRRREQS